MSRYVSDEAKRITEKLYKDYGTDTGVLLGIPPKLRESVRAIVDFALAEAQ